MAWAALMTKIDTKIRPRFASRTEASQIWQELLEAYGKMDTLLVYILIEDLGHLDSSNFKSIRTYGNFVQDRIVKFTKMECVIPESILVAFYVNGLGSEFSLNIFQLQLRATIEKRELSLDGIDAFLNSHDVTFTQKR